MNEWWLYQQFFSGGPTGLLAVVYLAFLFIVCLYRPERVRSRMLFRWACTLFGLAIIAQPVFTGVLIALGIAFQARGTSESGVLFAISVCAGPVLIGLSLVCALAAVGPGPPPRESARDEPTKHPLD